MRLNGEFIYLGRYGSEESRAAYNRVVAEWLASGRVLRPGVEDDGPSVNEVLLAYWRYAERYYVKPDGTPSREQDNILTVMRLIKELYGETAAVEFGPLALKTIRNRMIEDDLCRNTVNQRVGIVKRISRWAVAEEIVPSSVYHGLQAVAGLRQAARRTG